MGCGCGKTRATRSASRSAPVPPNAEIRAGTRYQTIFRVERADGTHADYTFGPAAYRYAASIGAEVSEVMAPAPT